MQIIALVLLLTDANDDAQKCKLRRSLTIVEHLKTHSGWHAKSDILAATGITDGQWNAAINDLLTNGKVERQGERRGAHYRLITDQKNQGEQL